MSDALAETGRRNVAVLGRPDQSQLVQQWRIAAHKAGWTTIDDAGLATIVIALTPPRSCDVLAGHRSLVAVVLDHVDDWVNTGAVDVASTVVAAAGGPYASLAWRWGEGIAGAVERLDAMTADGLPFAEVLSLAMPKPGRRRIGVSSCARSWDTALQWGDTHFGRALMRGFRRAGQLVTELLRPDWGRESDASCDVVVHLRGLARRPVTPDTINVLWIISHPDRVDLDEIIEYDIVMSASRRHADELTARAGRTVFFLPQAADLDSFGLYPKDASLEAPVIYVGNDRWPHRLTPYWLDRAGVPFHLHGQGWADTSLRRHLRSNYIPNRSLARAYRSAGVVIADHHPSMRVGGFVANRLFDVLASGGVVVSDPVVGLDELLGPLVPTYEHPHQLGTIIAELLEDPARRRLLARSGREHVLAHHSMDLRALDILRHIDDARAG